MTQRSLAGDPSNPSTHSNSQPQFHCCGKNVLSLLARREIAPRTKSFPRWHWGDTYKQDDKYSSGYGNEVLQDARRGLFSWVEAESLRYLFATVCPLFPPPKSTISVAFGLDGETLASTHGDHTVKIIDCETGICLLELDGHQRTPWVVKNHPKYPLVLASGGLDHEVRIWNVITAECIAFYQFYRPIVSIAFHAEGEVLAVASGRKLYIWHWIGGLESSSPAIILVSRRSIRAVDFHPYGGPFLLTAEATDIDSSDSSMTRATSIGSLHYPPTYSHNGSIVESTMDALEISEVLPDRDPLSSRRDQVLHSRDSMSWRLPFLRGWLMGQGQSKPRISSPLTVEGEGREHQCTLSNLDNAMVPGGSVLQHNSSRSHPISESDSRRGAASVSIPYTGNDSIPVSVGICSVLAASLAETGVDELPRTVRLRIWSHDIRSPYDPLEAGCRLIVPYAVLCSEMGAHFSPCGRFLAACVACVLPETEPDPSLFTQSRRDVSGGGKSPDRHPISVHQIMFELRIYSLEESTFGSVLVSRPIAGAHCLTSIQFSPTSEHIVLAYGRHHSSLLKTFVIDGESSLSAYTVLEVYRVSDMQLVTMLPSKDDEVNVACFLPSAGCGLVYGTKEGKLVFLRFEGSCER